MKISIRAIFLNPFVTDINEDIIHFSYKKDHDILSLDEQLSLNEKSNQQENQLKTIQKNLKDNFYIESESFFHKNSQYKMLQFNINIYDDLKLILNTLQYVDIIKIEILGHLFFTLTSYKSHTFTYSRVMKLYNKPALNENIIYPNNLFEDIHCQLEENILTIDFSYFLDFPSNNILMKGTEQELSLIFEFLCQKTSINIQDIQIFNSFIFYQGQNSQFITLALLCKLHKHSDKDYNSLSPSIEKLYMLRDSKKQSFNKSQIVKF